MEVTLTKTNRKFEFIANNGEYDFNIVASPDFEGGNIGFRPMQLLLEGLAGCMSIDILQILYKQRQEIEYFQVKVNADRYDGIPSVFTDIKMTIVAKGKIDAKKLKRAIVLSEEKYCSVHKMLEKATSISTTYILNDEPEV